MIVSESYLSKRNYKNSQIIYIYISYNVQGYEAIILFFFIITIMLFFNYSSINLSHTDPSYIYKLWLNSLLNMKILNYQTDGIILVAAHHLPRGAENPFTAYFGEIKRDANGICYTYWHKHIVVDGSTRLLTHYSLYTNTRSNSLL